MGKSVPTKSTLMDSGKSGIVDGGVLAAGEVAGRSLIGPGIGTMVGGLAAASSEQTEDGKLSQTGETMALIAVERGANELIGGM
jgi:hypothetical protein